MKQLLVIKARPRRINATGSIAVLLFLASAHVISGFIPPLPRVAAAKSKQNFFKKNPTFAAAAKDSHQAIFGSTSDDDGHNECGGSIQELSHDGLDMAQGLPIAATSLGVLAANPDPALAAVSTSPVASGLWAYAHYLSILVIVGCLTAERVIVKADMATVEEDQIVKIDLVYGLMAALLIISGFARATNFGKGGDFYIHEPLFWAKMTFSGVWGGLSLFPSLTFYRRNFARKNGEEVEPLSDELAKRLHQIINAEISAILSIPILATLMSRGVWYWDGFPYQIGLILSLAATGGSFYYYAKQALNWEEEEQEEESANEGRSSKKGD